MTRATGGITKFRLNGNDYDAVSGTISPFNTEKTPVNSLSGTPGYMEKYINPMMDITLQSTSGVLNPVVVSELQNLTGRRGEDAIIETNNGVTYLLHQVYVQGNPNYDIENGEISFQLIAKTAEQLYVRQA